MQAIRLASNISHYGSSGVGSISAVCIGRSSIRRSGSNFSTKMVVAATVQNEPFLTFSSSFSSLSSRHFSSSSCLANNTNIIGNNNDRIDDGILLVTKSTTTRRTKYVKTTMPTIMKTSDNMNIFSSPFSSKRFVQTQAGKKKRKKNPKRMIKHILSVKHEEEEEEKESTEQNEKLASKEEKDDEKESNTTNTMTYEDDEKEFNQSNPLLYKRSPNRTLLPRTLLTMTTLHTGYWMWYVLDFIPAMNANVVSSTAMEDPSLYTVDPTVGYVGLGLAIFMSVGSMVYPKYLISEIRSAYNGGGLYIKTHDLPFVTVPPTSKGYTLYQRSEVKIENPKDVTDIMYDLNGDLRLFQGHLALKSTLDSKANLLLEIREGEKEVLMGDVLWNSLIKDGAGGRGAGGVGKVAVKKQSLDGKVVVDDDAAKESYKMQKERRRKVRQRR